MKNIFLSPAVKAVVFTVSLGSLGALAQDSKPNLQEGHKGLKFPSQAEIKILHSKRVKKVKPNELGLERANRERAKRGLPPLNINPAKASDEMEVEILNDQVSASGTAVSTDTTSLMSIPSQVDNSTLPSFPPIGNQGGEGSCTTWATGYYQASHETCLLKGCDNKLSGEFRASPRWIYNQINGGVNQGSSWYDSFRLLVENGFTNLTEQPYTSGDYLRWNVNPLHWKNAISRRMLSYQTFSSLNTSTGLAAAKQALANGHVLTYATYISNWVYGQIGKDPAEPSPFAGQSIVKYVNGTTGGHMMTIVGFDDSIWTDINGNSVVDAGEKGAFKIANSWGSGWGYGGYMWVAYDAIQSTSAVAGAPSVTSRNSVFWSSAAYGMTAQQLYQPKLIVQFTINTAARNQVYLSVGSSASTASVPSSSKSTGTFIGNGGALAFNGTTSAVDGSFSLDISSFINSSGGVQNFYLVARDSVTGNPLQVKAITLLDLINSKSITYGGSSLSDILDATTKNYKIAYDFSQGYAPPVSVITAQVVNGANSTDVQFSGESSYDLDGVINSYLWDFGDGSNKVLGMTTSHSYSKAGAFNATLVVTNDRGQTGSSSYTINVPDLIAPSTPSNLVGNVTVVSARGKKGSTTTSVDLTWSSSTDNVAVKGYNIIRNGVVIATSSTNSYKDSSTSAGTSYTYSVVALDAAGNKSAESNPITIAR